MRNFTCKQCGRIFSENDADPAIHYSNPSTTCPTCETYNKKAIGDWYQTRDGEYKQKLPDVNLLAAAPDLLEALESSLEEMKDDWITLDGEFGPFMQEFGDIESAIKEEHASTKTIRMAIAAIAKARGQE